MSVAGRAPPRPASPRRAVRKAIAAVTEFGPEGCGAFIQGRLTAGDIIVEAGLVVQPKVAKVAARLRKTGGVASSKSCAELPSPAMPPRKPGIAAGQRLQVALGAMPACAHRCRGRGP